MGKSRLGRELLARHPEAAGMFARAHPLGVTAAFGVWTEAIDPLLRGRSDPQVTATCGGLLDDLASLFHRVAVIRASLPDREPAKLKRFIPLGPDSEPSGPAWPAPPAPGPRAVVSAGR